MFERIRDQVFIVTGATGGIGGAIADAVAALGGKLVLSGRDAGRLPEVGERVRRAGAEAIEVIGDLTQETDAQRLVAEGVAAFGRVDTLLNVAGLSVPAKIAEMDIGDYERVMDVNVRSAFLCSKHFVRSIDATRGGLIVNISSIAGKTANPNAPIYCAAKAALNMFSAGLALQAKASNVRVTTLSPGAVTTPGFWGDRPVPHEKFLTPADVADFVVFVASRPPNTVVHDVVFEPWDMFKSK